MRGSNRLITILSMALLVGFSTGCGNKESAAPQAAQTPTPAGNWQTTMPAKFAGLTAKDGGACFLDAVNGPAAGPGPILIKSLSPMSLAGWAVDLKAGRLGSALGIQLNGATPYYIAADGYPRPGLGAALKSSPSLDGGGLKLDATPLNVPAGDYRVVFLIQSDNDLLRCDTGHTLRVE